MRCPHRSAGERGVGFAERIGFGLGGVAPLKAEYIAIKGVAMKRTIVAALVAASLLSGANTSRASAEAAAARTSA